MRSSFLYSKKKKKRYGYNYTNTKSSARQPGLRKRITHNALAFAAATQDGKNILKNIQNKEFDNLMKQAYASKEGYVIEEYQGNKIMILAGSGGTTTVKDWKNNFTESVQQIYGKRDRYGRLPKGADMDQKAQARKFDAIARKEKPDIIFGHSRGATYMTHMSHDESTYIALDGAMSISTGFHRDRVFNIRQGAPYATTLKRLADDKIAGDAKEVVTKEAVAKGVSQYATGAADVYATYNWMHEKALEFGDALLSAKANNDVHEYVVNNTNLEQGHTVWNQYQGYEDTPMKDSDNREDGNRRTH